MPNCLISGTLADVNGSRIQRATVAVRRASSPNNPIFVGTQAISDEEHKILTDENGQFSISLVQGLDIVMRIDAIGLHRQVRVPEQASATLEEVLNADV